MSKTINRGWLKRQIEKGNIEGKCCYSMTDDYAWDAANNHGKTENWVDARDFKLDDRSFKTKSGCAYQDENGTISLIIHSNRAYDLRLKEIPTEISVAEIIDISELIYNPMWCVLKKQNCPHADFKRYPDKTTSFKCKAFEDTSLCKR